MPEAHGPERREPPLRVLVYCGGSYVSGTEIVALSVMQGLVARGHSVRCLVNGWNDGDFPERLRQAGIPHARMWVGIVTKSLRPRHVKWTLEALLRLPYAAWRFRKELGDFRPDVVIFNGFLQASLLRPWVPAARSVFHVHDLVLDSLHARRVVGEMGATARFIAVSERVRQSLLEAGAETGRVTVVHNGVALPQEHLPTPEADGFSQPVHVVLIGQVNPLKGHEDLMHALALLNERGVRIRATIVGRGDPAFTKHLQRLAEAGGVGDLVAWAGFVSDLSDVYRQADIVAVPSRIEEAFGLVAAEAGAHGVPVVVTRRGGLPEVVDEGHTGLIIDAESPLQLADALEALARDPERRRRMGAAGRHHVETRFSSDTMLANIEQALRVLA